jgi:hypothetical protein
MTQAILLVEHDDAVREGLAMALHESGQTVITCSDVESAQVVVKNERIGAVVCDARISGRLSIDGIEGTTHFLAKPFDVAELEAALGAAGRAEAASLSHVPPLFRILGRRSLRADPRDGLRRADDRRRRGAGPRRRAALHQ